MECVNRSGLRHLRAAPFVAPPHGKLYPYMTKPEHQLKVREEIYLSNALDLC